MGDWIPRLRRSLAYAFGRNYKRSVYGYAVRRSGKRRLNELELAEYMALVRKMEAEYGMERYR